MVLPVLLTIDADNYRALQLHHVDREFKYMQSKCTAALLTALCKAATQWLGFHAKMSCKDVSSTVEHLPVSMV